MRNFKNTVLLIISLFIVAVMLCGCASSESGNFMGKKSGLFSNSALESYDDAAQEEGTEFEASNSSVKSEQVSSNRKIIEYFNYTVETKDFDKLLKNINAAVKKSGGYTESSEIGGNSYYNSDFRTAQLKIRIPKTKQTDFSDFISKNSNVVSKSVNTEDITDSYIDTQSRIKALTIEKETLEKLLAKSSKVSDTLTVYEKLTDVIAEIESYQGKLNKMDNLIDYTTFTVYITEVEKETDVKKQNWFVSTWNKLSNNFFDVLNGILVFLSFIISALPYWILLGIIALTVILIIFSVRKKRRNRRQ